LGFFGAPKCRFTTSIIALLAITIGMTLATGGICILVFFIDQEPTILPLGVTLSILGLIMFIIGSLMWCSEFMCNDCLGRG
jgi:drug/metabolite transporter (DMT)-like permease